MKTTFCLTTMFCFQILISAQDIAFQSEKLKMVWETIGFDTPESVCFDVRNNVYYISNIGGMNPAEKDGNGFISKLSPDGKVIELKWIEGLNAPKGMGISEGYLFVTDIDKLIIIDIAIGEIEEELFFAGSKFLNDLAINKDGAIYISDSEINTFYKYYKGKNGPFIFDESFNNPNGIITELGSIIAGTGNYIIVADPTTGKWSHLIDNTGTVDGIAKVGEGQFIVSDWSGKIYFVYTNKEKELLLNTTNIEGRNAADFCYNSTDNLLLVPTFFNNTVICYKVVTEN